MDDIHAAFKQFCASHGIEPSDRDFVMYLAGLQSTLDQQPVAYGHFAPDGSLLQMLQFLEPNRISKPVPLYAKPVANVPKPDLHESVLEHVWNACYRDDNDVIGFARWVERYSKAMI